MSKVFHVGDLLPPWSSNTCDCGEKFHMTRAVGRVMTKEDLVCATCLATAESHTELTVMRKALREVQKLAMANKGNQAIYEAAAKGLRGDSDE